jgi:MFS family permease
MKAEKNQKKISLIPLTIWAIGFVTLLMNLSSIVVFSLSPIYLTSVLGVTNLGIGIFEGAVEALSWFTRIFSGVISDFWRKRKPLLFVASTFAALSRPILAWAPSVGWVFFARSIDRIGNGLQATPREALVGDHAPSDLKGACYGLRQTLSVVGSLLGAIGVYYWLQKPGVNYRHIFWGASIPPVLALVILFCFVKESPLETLPKAKQSFIANLKLIKQLKSSFWRVIVVAFIFMLSNYSGAFMILQAKTVTQQVTIAPQTMIFQNLATMLAAFPIGRLSDRIDRRILLSIGFMIAIVANCLLGFAVNTLMILLGSALWGAQLGITQSLLVTKVADHTTPEVRGTAFGIYYLLIGLSIFLANSQAGWLFQHYKPVYGFMVSSFYALLALFCLPLLRSHRKSIYLS